jgi:hypothetical protein
LENNDHFIYTNETDKGVVLVVANFRDYPIDVTLSVDVSPFDVVYSNCETPVAQTMTLAPYDAMVLFQKKE